MKHLFPVYKNKIIFILFLIVPLFINAQVLTKDSMELVNLYNSTNGKNWLNNTNWLSSQPVSTWYGVQTNENRVIEIFLGYNNLINSIPESIGNLDKLEYLYLSGNKLSGNIPTSITNCIFLKNFYLDNNQLSGSIPFDIDNFQELINFNVANNQFSGTLPNTLGLLSKLVMLNCSFNQFTGSIPATLSNCKKLFSLDLAYNQLTGIIPPELEKCKNLFYLGLGNNLLTGTVPANYIVNPYCVYTLNNNQLNGALPLPADTLFNFQDLSGNKFNTFSGFDPGINLCRELYYGDQNGDSIPIKYNGSQLSVSAGGNVANNEYRWYKTGFLDRTIIGDSIYPISGPGRYYVVVVNYLVGDIKLVSQKIDLTTLPVQFINFSATLQNKDALLKFSTANEVNVSNYIVQRSIDGINFTSLASINAQNNKENNYQYIDLNVTELAKQHLYYRIQEIDNDGVTYLSKIINLTINPSITSILTYPNPVKDFINIIPGEPAFSLIKILNINGNVVYEKGITLPNKINLSSLAGGVYFLDINVNGVIKRTKIIKE